MGFWVKSWKGVYKSLTEKGRFKHE